MTFRQWMTGLVCAGILACAAPLAVEAAPTVSVNQQNIAFPDQGAVIQQGRTLVPIRFVAESLGAEVQWTGGNRQASIYTGNNSIVLDIGRNQVASNGHLVALDVYPQIMHGRTMVPLRFIAETMGLDVAWDAATERVTIQGTLQPPSQAGTVVLGNERLFTDYHYLIDGKNVGLATNQTGVNSQRVPTTKALIAYPNTIFMAAFAPEHGVDGTAPAGQYITSYWDAGLNVPVYSIYGPTREPSTEMLKNVDVLLFDMQDIGSRTYTYMSSLNYCMRAAAKHGLPIVVLDRPNPVGGDIVEGYMMQDRYQTFVGVDTLPLAHGMTAGELALYFNRKIGADLHIVPMRGYKRSMVFQDTGLPFVQTSPNIPTLDSAFKYMATGMGDGTGMGQADYFNWVGMAGLNADTLAATLNHYGLPGITFLPEWRGDRGGVRLQVTDYHTFNPARTAVYILLTADRMVPLGIPTEGVSGIPMFEKIWGSPRFSQALRDNLSPEQAVASYQTENAQFRITRQPYLLYE